MSNAIWNLELELAELRAGLSRAIEGGCTAGGLRLEYEGRIGKVERQLGVQRDLEKVNQGVGR